MKRVKAYEAGFRMGIRLGPPFDCPPLENAEFKIINRRLAQVLRNLLGCSESEIARLRESQVVC